RTAVMYSCAMSDDLSLDALFRGAVGAIDSGDEAALDRMLREHPRVASERLGAPGAWLKDKVGGGFAGVFQAPYPRWVLAGDPVRSGRWPRSAAGVARVIIAAARRAGAGNLQEQIDYALRLVCWSWIARDSGVQIELIDALLEAGASPDGSQLYDARFGTHSD